MRVPNSLRWIGLALLGLMIAVAVAIAASQLASRQIGIASESVSAGNALAPPVTTTHKRRHEDGGHASESEKEPGSTAKSKAPAEETEPGVGTETGVGKVPAVPVEATESVESEAPRGTAGPRSDDSGGDGAGQAESNAGGGRDD